MGHARSAMSTARPALNVWITRTDTACQSSAAAVRAAGFTPLIGPVLKLSAVSTPNACPPDDNAIAFTSPNGVRAFTALTDRRIWPVFTVGDATANIARAAGFETVQSASGSVDDLAALILKSGADAVTHLSGVHVAGDLSGALRGAAIDCRREIIYGTQAVTALGADILAVLGSGRPLIVLLYSPKGAHTFLSLLPKAIAAPLHVISISSKTDATLRGADALFTGRYIAETPDEPSMLGLLEAAALKA